MKILQINAVYSRLSTGRNVYELNNAFRAQGHCCVAAYPVGAVEDPETEYLIGGVVGQKMHALLSRITGTQGYFSSHATRKLLRFMDRFQPDVVVLNNLHANYIHLPMLLKYLAKKDIPTVAVLHDCWFYTGKCCFYTTAGCQKWKDSCGNCPMLKAYNKSWFFDHTKKMLNDRKELFGAIPRLGVVAVSDWILNEAKQSPVFANASVISRIYNWIDTDCFCPSDTDSLRETMNLKGKKLLLGVAATWEARKGLETILWIAEQLQGEAELVLVGKLPENRQYPANTHKISATASTAELAQIYSMADVFIQPSLEETFGKVTAEALSCGTPVVCFDSTANPELVGERCGAVVPVGDWEAMLQEVRSVLDKGKEHYAQYCREYALQNFGKSENTKQYLRLFQKTMHAEKSEEEAI